MLTSPSSCPTANVTHRGAFPAAGACRAAFLLVGGIVNVSTGAPSAPITDNTVADSVTFGIDAAADATGVVIKSNTVTNAARGGIAFDASGATIQSNKLVANPIGIEFTCSTATISGNTISNATTGLNDVPLNFTPGANTFDDVNSIHNQTTCTSSEAASAPAAQPRLPLIFKRARRNG